jgi:hypothetical protein
LAFKHNPYAQSMHGLYAALHRIAGMAGSQQFPPPVPEQHEVLARAFGEFPKSSWSDGIVPTLSQIWGEVIHATSADHLDVVGHYGSLRPGELTTDWLPSRSGFDDRAFDALWSDVARFISAEAREPAVHRHRHNVGVERTRHEPRKVNREPDLITAESRAREALKPLEPQA